MSSRTKDLPGWHIYKKHSLVIEESRPLDANRLLKKKEKISVESLKKSRMFLLITLSRLLMRLFCSSLHKEERMMPRWQRMWACAHSYNNTEFACVQEVVELTE